MPACLSTPLARSPLRGPLSWIVAVAGLLGVFGAGAVDAYSMDSRVSYNIGVATDIPDPGLLSETENASSTTYGVPADVAIDSGLLALTPYSTQVQTTAEANASGFDMGVGTHVSIQDRDLAQGGESIEATASVTFEDFVTQSEAEAIFLSPILHLSGEVSNTTPDLRSILSLVVSSPGTTELFRFDSAFDGPSTTVDQQVLGPALSVAPGASIFLRIRLAAQTGRSVSLIGAGDHAGTVDFLGTASLLGFAAFADAEMTQPLPDVVVSSGDGFSYETLTVPEAGTGVLLCLGLSAWVAAGGQRGARRRR